MTHIRWRSLIVLALLIMVGWTVFSPTPQLAFGRPGGGGGNGPQGGNGGGNGGPGNNNNINNGTPGGPQNRQGGNPLSQLGRAIFFDTNISNPIGMSCASCHAPETGFSYPVSAINQNDGVVPGVQSSRFGNRKPMSISYSWFIPDGLNNRRRRGGQWEGGFFSDGRADTLEEQAGLPMVNPNEMDNTLHGLASPDLVVRKVLAGSYTSLFKQAFGDDVLTKPSTEIFLDIRTAIAEFERSREVSPFSSKYDAVNAGEAEFTPSELNGLRLFTGSMTGRPGGAPSPKSAECISCHKVEDDSGRRDFFTNWTYANIGVPKNSHNPFYKQTHKISNPQGYNPDGDKFVDLGLGAIVYPKQNLPPGNIGPGSDGRGDFLAANGMFRVASLRNVDKRPAPGFVKSYMHNGVFKSLKDVVHFYNTRNLTKTGEVMNLTSANPQAGVKGKPIWPAPEFASDVTLQNPAGRSATRNASVGNLGLTNEEEADIVAFLGTLSDGYFTPARRRPPPGN